MSPGRWRERVSARWVLAWLSSWATVYLLSGVAIGAIADLGVVAQGQPTWSFSLRPIRWIPAYLMYGWDSGWYARLARNYDGYMFPPGYPLVLRALGGWGYSLVQSAVIVNLVAHGAAIAGILVIAHKRRLPLTEAWWVAVFVLLFPGHNVFFAAYSESLFLAVTVAAFACHAHDRVASAALLAGLSALVRTLGSFLAAALLLCELERAWREKSWRRLPAASLGLLIVVAWNLYVRYSAQTDLVADLKPWLDELVKTHVPAGVSARTWVFEYLFFWTAGKPGGAAPGVHKEVFFSWAFVGAALVLRRRGYRLAFFYLATFGASLALYTYRPFDWTRYLSVLFPWAFAWVDVTRRRPKLRAVSLAASVILGAYFQAALFSNRMGEP